MNHVIVFANNTREIYDMQVAAAELVKNSPNAKIDHKTLEKSHIMDNIISATLKAIKKSEKECECEMPVTESDIAEAREHIANYILDELIPYLK